MIGVIPEDLPKFVRADFDTGALTWLPRGRDYFRRENDWRSWNTQHAEKPAFNSPGGDGYLCGGIFYKTYWAHRIIWCLAHGDWPAEFIDHIDGNGRNNSLSNLRLATIAQNNRNRVSKSTATSKYLGVCWLTKQQKWQAQIYSNGSKRDLGRFDCEIAAAAAYDRAAKELFGEFARPNLPSGEAA